LTQSQNITQQNKVQYHDSARSAATRQTQTTYTAPIYETPTPRNTDVS